MTARQRVLNYLTKNRTASAREVARGLKMSIETVRHHLRVLVADGRLEAEFARGREEDAAGPRRSIPFHRRRWGIICRRWRRLF